MTREEARRCLQAMKFMLDIEQYSDEIEQALNMAIEALKEVDELEKIIKELADEDYQKQLWEDYKSLL